MKQTKARLILERLKTEQKLNEVLIQFGKASDTKFGNIVILAGGGGSGKGFVLSNLLDIQGKVFDVDHLKSMALDSEYIRSAILKDQGLDISTLSLKNPDDVSTLHNAISKSGLERKLKDTFFASVFTAHPDRKPNLIFDVTLKSPDKLAEIAKSVEKLGYDKTKIHLVWVINDVEVAIEQNAKRSRTISTDILNLTHQGVASTLYLLLQPANQIHRIIDGKVVFAFNKAKVDSVVVTGDKKQDSIFNRETKPFYVKQADYVVVKEIGKHAKDIDDIESKFLNKIVQYVPDSVKGLWQFALDKALGKDN